MKILYVFRSLAIWGGIERILVDKMNNLVKMYGYEVYMLTSDQGSHPVPYFIDDRVFLEDMDIKFHYQYRYKGLYRLYDRYKRLRLFKKRLRKKIIDICPDIIVCVADGYLVPIYEVKGSIPLLVESHNNFSYLFQGVGLMQKILYRQQKRTLSKVDALVTLTAKDAEEWKTIYKGVRVIPNFVQQNNTGECSNSSNHRVIYVGRLEAQKRVFDIVEIWKRVYSRFPDWHLDIYGEGEYRQQLEHVCSDLRMNIIIHSPTNRIFDCYRKSDILILTSEYEPFGLVIPEAMSCGLPVVSYRSQFGPESIITDGYDGFLVPLGNMDFFSERLCQLMGNIILRKEMGRRAFNSSLQYTAEKIMPLWKSLFEEITGN